jgi:cell division protein ZapA
MLHTEFSEVSLEIAGRNYKLKTPQHQQQGLQEAAALLNEKIAELKSKSRTLSAEQAAVLAALNLSYELLTERELLAQDRQHIAERLAQLQQQVESSLD